MFLSSFQVLINIVLFFLPDFMIQQRFLIYQGHLLFKKRIRARRIKTLASVFTSLSNVLANP